MKDVSGMCYWREALGQTEDLLERFLVLAGLGMTWCPPSGGRITCINTSKCEITEGVEIQYKMQIKW